MQKIGNSMQPRRGYLLHPVLKLSQDGKDKWKDEANVEVNLGKRRCTVLY